MLILLLTVSRHYLFLWKSHYQTHTTIQHHQFIFHGNNLSTSSRADQYVVSDEISDSYERTKSHPKHSVVFKGTKLFIGINCYPEDLKAPSTLLNGSSSSFIIGINTTF